MSLTNRQWSRVRMVFHPNRYYPNGTPRTNVQQIEVELEDLIECSITKSLSSVAGGFSATLVPRQDYLTGICPNDWVEIYLDTAQESKDPIMVASVDRVGRRKMTAANGAVQEVIIINGRDYGKVFLSTVLIIDPLIGAQLEQAAFRESIIINTMSGNDIPLNRPDEVVGALLARYHDFRTQCVPPASLFRKSLLVRNLGVTRGINTLASNYNLNGNLWGTMEQFVNPVLNEMWVDTIAGVPTLVVRERPFSHEDFARLPSVELEATEVTAENIGKSDDDTRNWFRMYGDSQSVPREFVDAANVGYVNSNSVIRSGFRKMEATTSALGDYSQAFVDNQNGDPSGLLQEWSGIIAEWNANNDLLLEGSMTARARPDARIGSRLDYTNARTGERLSFYIEGVSHSYRYPQGATTSLTLTRGVERNSQSLTFPLLKGLEEITLTDDGRLSSLTAFDTDPLKRVQEEQPTGRTA